MRQNRTGLYLWDETSQSFVPATYADDPEKRQMYVFWTDYNNFKEEWVPWDPDLRF